MRLPLENRWLGLIALLALGFGGAVVLAFRFVRVGEPPPKPATSVTPTGIGIARIDQTSRDPRLREQSLLDPDPLFLPTPLNASQLELPRYERQPGTTQQTIDAKYLYGEDVAAFTLPDPIAAPTQPGETLAYGLAQNPYAGLGRFARAETPLPPRAARLEVVQTKTGRVVLSVSLALSETNPPAALANSEWSPLELLAAIDSTGMIGQPTLARGSGVETIDTFFRSFLAQSFHLGEQLPTGLYTLRIGP
jgi:hypothetical protein